MLKNDDIIDVEATSQEGTTTVPSFALSSDDCDSNLPLASKIKQDIDKLNPMQTAEQLAQKQKKNQLTAETLISEIDLPNITKTLQDFDTDINNKKAEIKKINNLIDPLILGLTNNPNLIDENSTLIISNLNSMRVSLNTELNTLRMGREKITDKYYKLRQSVKEPTINIAQFNMDSAQNMFDKFKIKKNGKD